VTGDDVTTTCARLREAGVACLPAAADADARAHALAWECSHLLTVRDGGFELVVLGTGATERLATSEDVVARIRQWV